MRPIMNGELPETCGVCGEPRMLHTIGKGKKAKTHEVCGCAPAPEKPGPRKCSKKGAKAKGDGEEREISKTFASWGYDAYRTAGSGAHGSRNNEAAFATDVRVKLNDRAWRIESKRHARVAGLKSMLNLKGGSEILWVREDRQEAFVLMSADVFSEFARALSAANRGGDNG